MTTTIMGPNTKRINISDNDYDQSTVITYIRNVITSMGWSLYDTFQAVDPSVVGSFPGDGTWGGFVFRSLNYDGVSYKYAILRFDTPRRFMYLSTCESWNNTTHVPTNECWTGHGFPMPWSPDYCDIVINANSRWLLIQSYLNGDSGNWCAVMEFEREAEEDTAAAGFPCWAFTCSELHMQYDNNGIEVPACALFGYCFPRLRDGSTGYNAAVRMGTISGSRLFLSWNSNIASSMPGSSMLYEWDPSKSQVHSLSPTMVGEGDTPSLNGLGHFKYGRAFGFKLTRPITGAEQMNKLSLKVDTDGFFDPTGSATDHFVFPFNGSGPLRSRFYISTDALSYGPQYTTCVIPGGSTYYVNATAHAGAFWYVATSNGIYKINGSTNAVSAVISGTSGTFFSDIVWDESTGMVWAAGPLHIWRINPASSDAVTSYAVTGGAKQLVVTNGKIIATSRQSATTLNVSSLNKSNQTVQTVTTSGWAAAVNWSGATYCYNGYVAMMMVGSATAGDHRLMIYDVVNNTLTAAYTLNIPSIAVGGLHYSPVSGILTATYQVQTSTIYLREFTVESNGAVTLVNSPSSIRFNTITAAVASNNINVQYAFNYHGGVTFSGLSATETSSGLPACINIPSTFTGNSYSVNANWYQLDESTLYKTNVNWSFDGVHIVANRIGTVLIMRNTFAYKFPAGAYPYTSPALLALPC